MVITGKPQNSDGIINFMASKYNEHHSGKKYDFSKFSGEPNVNYYDEDNTKKSKFSDFNLKRMKSKNNGNSSSDDEDAIIYNYKKNNN